MQPTDSSSAGALVLALLAILLIPIMIIGVIALISYWKIYTKAGKPGWAILIPIYNVIVFLDIIGKPVWWILLFLIPGVNVIFAIWATNLLSKSFGQGAGFTVGLIFLSFIFLPVLAFGNYTYLGPGGEAGFQADPALTYVTPGGPTTQL